METQEVEDLHYARTFARKLSYAVLQEYLHFIKPKDPAWHITPLQIFRVKTQIGAEEMKAIGKEWALLRADLTRFRP